MATVTLTLSKEMVMYGLQVIWLVYGFIALARQFDKGRSPWKQSQQHILSRCSASGWRLILCKWLVSNGWKADNILPAQKFGSANFGNVRYCLDYSFWLRPLLDQLDRFIQEHIRFGIAWDWSTTFFIPRLVGGHVSFHNLCILPVRTGIDYCLGRGVGHERPD